MVAVAGQKMTFQNNLHQNGSAYTARTTVIASGESKIRQKTFSLGTSRDNKDAAREWLSCQERLRAGLSLLSPSGPATLGEVVGRYLEVVDVKPVTRDCYDALTTTALKHFGHLHHPFLTQQEIDQYISQRRDDGAGRSIIKELSCLRWALIRFNIIPEWSIPKHLHRIPKKESYVPTVDDYHRLSSELPPEGTRALRMALYAGLRDQEVYRVGWECYAPLEGILRIPAGVRKTNSSNVVPVVYSLSSRLSPPQLTGKIVSQSQSVIKGALRGASRRAGIRPWFGLQPARRLFVTLAEDGGYSQDTIALITGHSRQSMVSRYSGGTGRLELKRKVIKYVEGRLQ